MPRVLVLTQHYAPEENAPALRWSWLAAGLAARGFHVHVLTTSWAGTGVERPSADLMVHRVSNVLAGRSILRRLTNEGLVAAKSLGTGVKAPRPDLIIATVPPLSSLPLARILALRHRCPLVCDLRDAWPELLGDWPEWNQDGVNAPRRGPVRRQIMAAGFGLVARWLVHLQRHSQLVVTTSESYAEEVRKRVSATVICIRNAPSCEPVPPPEPWIDEEFKVLYLGNVGRAQHLATAVRAAAIVQTKGIRLKLRIVGDGAQLPSLKVLAQRLAAPVEFVGRVPRKDARSHYAWADTVLVMLRDWAPLTMTVPSKLYEALSTGRHVSASVAGEAAEIVSSTGAGDVVPPEDAESLAQLWIRLASDRSGLIRPDATEWLRTHTDPELLADRFAAGLRVLVEEDR